MDFNIIWECDIGTTVTVSNGEVEPQPSEMLNKKWRIWYSKNFTGTITDKFTDTIRYIQFQIIHPTSEARFTLSEPMNLTYSSDELNAAALTVYEEALITQVNQKAIIKIPTIEALLIYAKWQEVKDVNEFGIANVIALPAAEREARFPFMVAEYTENPGLTPQDVLDRFTLQTEAKLIKVGKIEARRSRIIREIEAATTQADKETAANTSWDDI